jgi:hydroxypyruvate reductase
VRVALVATLDDARRAAADAARHLGLGARVHPELVAGEAVAAGARLAQALRQAAPGEVQIWGGETTVRLPPVPGRGGRCQTLALAAARALAGCDDVWLLAAGTDGSDGPGDDAGALVDGGTTARAALHGIDAAQALAAADAGTLLEASGDLMQTGPTGTNVMDLVLGLRL